MTYSFSQFTKVEGQYIDLVPLTQNLVGPLTEALFSPNTFFVAQRGYNTKEIVQEKIQERLNAQIKGESLTVIAIDKKINKLAAMSSYLFPSSKWTKVEIGFTWIADNFKRSYVNTELKLLMLDYAFNSIKLKRVEFSIDPDNAGSLKAIERIGATYEGTLRKWRYNSPTDHGNRSIFSILDDEWPLVKTNLQKKLC